MPTGRDHWNPGPLSPPSPTGIAASGGKPHRARRQRHVLSLLGLVQAVGGAVTRLRAEDDLLFCVEVHLEAGGGRPRDAVAEQRVLVRQAAEVDQQQARRQGDCERLEPELEGLDVRDPAHSPERHVEGDDRADHRDAEPVGGARDLLQGDARPLELRDEIEAGDAEHDRRREQPIFGEPSRDSAKSEIVYAP